MDTLDSLYAANTPARFWRLLAESGISNEEWEMALRNASSILPESVTRQRDNGRDLISAVLSEALLGDARWQLSSSRRLYYSLKPFLPQRMRVWLRKRYQSKQQSGTGLNWPVEHRYVRFQFQAVENIIAGRRAPGLPFLHFWPKGRQFALVLTHDVETAQGQDFVRELASLEERYGFRSSFNFVPQRYPLDHALIAELRERGFEVGVHGLRHDGKLFLSRARFERRAVRINQSVRELHAVGFRSPLMHRHAAWMQALDIRYDLSFFDTDPYEPMPGGTMSIWPFFLGRFVELPYTLVQDHTLLVILGEKTPRLWLEKVDFIEQSWGMALLISHPDYLCDHGRLGIYEEFLQEMRARQGYWHALPRDVADWWRARAEAKVELHAGQWVVRDLPDGCIGHLGRIPSLVGSRSYAQTV